MRVHRGRTLAVRLVDRHVGQVVEDLGATVGRAAQRQQLGPLLDERRRHASRTEVGVVQNRLQERDVRGDTADAELRDGAAGAGDGGLEVATTAGQLDEHRVEVGADLCAQVRAAVQAHARATRGAVRGDPTGVGAESVGGVLGRDAALQCGAADRDLVVRQTEIGQRLARRDAQLRLHQIDVGDLLGDRVLHLDSRVHLDEDVVAAGVEEELDRARAAVTDLLGERDRVGADPISQCGIEIGGRRELDHLLVPPLQRAVALEQVDDVALAVGEDLYLDVTRVDDGLFEEHRRITERRLGLSRGRLDRLPQLRTLGDPAHTASAAAGDGLDEDGELHVLGGREQRLDVRRGLRRCQHRQARCLRGRDRTRLVAGQLEYLG